MGKRDKQENQDKTESRRGLEKETNKKGIVAVYLQQFNQKVCDLQASFQSMQEQNHERNQSLKRCMCH